MTRIVFYEKPGCANNPRQKPWLAAVGQTIEARNLLTRPWTGDELLRDFGNRPAADRFDRGAPRIERVEVNPESLDAAEALSGQFPRRAPGDHPLRILYAAALSCGVSASCNCVTKSSSGMSIRSMCCSARKRCSIRVGSPGSTAQC